MGYSLGSEAPKPAVFWSRLGHLVVLWHLRDAHVAVAAWPCHWAARFAE